MTYATGRCFASERNADRANAALLMGERLTRNPAREVSLPTSETAVNKQDGVLEYR